MAVPKRTIDYDEWLLTRLKDPDAAAAYLNEHLIAGVDADELFLIALRNVAQAHEVSRGGCRSGTGGRERLQASTLIGARRAVLREPKPPRTVVYSSESAEEEP